MLAFATVDCPDTLFPPINGGSLSTLFYGYCVCAGNALIISRIFHYFKIEVHVGGGDLDCKTSLHIRNAFLGDDQFISLSVKGLLSSDFQGFQCSDIL